jgi:hypothetical protein
MTANDPALAAAVERMGALPVPMGNDRAYRSPAPHISRADVPLARLAADLRATVARQKFEQRMAPLKESLAHPETPMPSRPVSPGERAEFSHLLYDADPDATVPAFPYPTTQEAS